MNYECECGDQFETEEQLPEHKMYYKIESELNESD